MAAWTTLARAAAAVLFPPVCVGCGGLVEASGYRHLCGRCAPAVALIAGGAGAPAGQPDGPGAGGRPGGEAAPDLGQARAAVRLEGPARALLLELKYRGGRHVLEDMAEIFRRSPALLAHVRGAALVPVPLHPRKERERGFNQSALLAAVLAREAGGGTAVAGLLQRVVDTPTQTGLDRDCRRANLKNAFALASGAVLNARLRYLLVDDVFTTGSTLNGCARVLRGAGSGVPDVATYGHG
jgi:ComF family protein